MSREVKYRLEVDYYSLDYEDRLCSTSEPIYTLSDGINKYKAATKEKCIDIDAPARVHLWKYDGDYDENGHFIGKELTLAKNY